MDDLAFGTRDKRGNWTPTKKLEIAPVFVFPPRPAALLKWLPHYLFPWNFLFTLSAVLYWYLVIPEVATLKVLSWDWTLRLLLVNAIVVFLFYGVFELFLYSKRSQNNQFKYNARFPADHKNSAFFFQNQNIDSLIRGFGTGVPIWTLLEVLGLHAYALGIGTWWNFSEHPLYLFCLALVLPILHETHFYLIHRLIHTPFLYKWVHSVHHNSVNPSPWSSLSMHPVEHLLYFSSIFYHLLIPSNPILMLYQINFAGFGAIVGHIGFDQIKLSDKHSMNTNAYAHYLHHKYFEVNYGDASVPLDKWFGTWHDGTAEGERLMQARFEARKAQAEAKKMLSEKS